nr:lymphocyte antigen 6 complex locus protein G6f isoform X1 [Loxodonta africana]
MAVLFLFLLFLCQHSQAEAENIQAIYVALGEAMELPCPSPPTLHGDEYLSWFRSSAASSSTMLVAQAQVARPAPDPVKLGRESRLKLLGNYSLWLEGTKEGDAGRYWCAVLGQHYTYQNWRVYDISVLRGSQLSARTADGSPCSVLLCSVIPSRRLDSVTWLEGKGPMKGRVQSFWGEGAALLLVCPGEGLPEPRSRRPRIIRCLMPQNKGVSFTLAAAGDASPTPCARSTGWDISWILMLLLAAGQGVIILTLSIVLWRHRLQRTSCRSGSLPPRGKERVYGCGPSHLTSVASSLGEGVARNTDLGCLVTHLPHLLHPVWLLLPRCLDSSVQTRNPSLREHPFGLSWPTCPQDQVILVTSPAGKCDLLSPWPFGT